MSGVDAREAVWVLAKNLASMWTGGRAVLDAIVDAGGDPSASPVAALQKLGAAGLNKLLDRPGFGVQVTEAFGSLSRYLAADTWFDRASAADERLTALRQAPVAYFCMEYGLASWLPIYSGGLGILAGDFLKEASDMGIPLAGVGLFYRSGFFRQRLDEYRYQHELVPTVDPAGQPVEAVRSPLSGKALRVPVPIGHRTVYAGVWKLRVGRAALYLLDTDVAENARAEDREITSNLYGGDMETRIQQELVLGIGGKRALEALSIEPSIFSMNEGHAAFLGLEVLANLLDESDFGTALERTRNHIVFTNHTVVPAGNDVFPRDLVRRYLSPYTDDRGIGIERLLGLGGSGMTDTFSMPLLAFQLAGKANAVSKLHAEVIPREWPGYTVEAVTNGVHVPTWVGPEIRALLDRYVPDWLDDEPDWERILDIPDGELQEARARQRSGLVDFVNGMQADVRLDPDALTIVWARRFAEYKRAWLIASDLGRLSRLLSDANRPVQLVISGKAHPRDGGGKRMMQELLDRLRSDAEVAARSVFIEDYTERVARCLVAGADVWLNTPRKPLEASGTSGMKSGDNGGLQLTVKDGWAAEVDWWGKGWGIDGHDDQADQHDLYNFLEGSAVPLFYERDGKGTARGWARMMKNSMITTLSRYSARRMLREYLQKLYLPLLAAQGGMEAIPAEVELRDG
jgi:starch phosphorylase